MNCHTLVKPESPKLEGVLASYETGLPIEWVKVHHVADYAYFSHQAHVNRGVGCVSCHGRIDQMEEVYQAEPLSMGWCLDCHRNPEPNLRPVDQVTNMTWGLALGLTGDALKQEREKIAQERAKVLDLYHINPSENCSTCHR